MNWLDLQAIAIEFGALGLLFIVIAIVWYFLQWQRYFYAWALGLPKPQFRVSIHRDLMIQLSDGVTLLADLYTPHIPDRYPTIIMRTPYGKANNEHAYPLTASILVCQGYNVLIQDVRGKYSSEGTFHPFVNEERDGKETVDWAAQQEWSNGDIALFGFSYLGSCAWLTTPQSSKSLKTIIPMFSCQNAYMGWIDRGVPYLKDILFWLSKHHGRRGREVSHDEVDNIILQLPVLQFDKRLRDGIDTFKTWMSHLQEDEFWLSFSVSQRRDQINIPALMVGGWFDRFLNNTMSDYAKTVTANPNSLTAKSRLIIGPWGHQPIVPPTGINFGRSAKFRSQFYKLVNWLDVWLKGQKPLYDENYPIDYFMMGKNEWRKTNKWPPPGVEEVKFFLDGDGKANTVNGDGKLVKEPPDEIQADTYVYDPERPSPSIGNKMLYGNNTDGPREQSEVIKRDDVLVFVTETLKYNFEIAGPVTAVLYVASSALDTDFSAKLCDMHPNGKTYYLLSGFVRMRFLDSVRATHGIESDKVYRIEIYLGQTAHTFLKGHRIQLQVSSSDFPNHERNLNTGGSNEGDSDEITATQFIFHGGIYGSHINLPHLC